MQFPGSARIQELAGLCEQIGKALSVNRDSADPLPAEAAIPAQYDMGSVDFHVTVDTAEETEISLDVFLTVTP